ncbi:MAG: class I SAM-dependent methyltransferase [Pseudomonadales bacterium]|nr:class I SAM-dependent methyltransferase [Pseudomonadales bacterium]
MNGVQIELGPVQETLLIPLLGRAEETRSNRGLINDPKAIEIVDSLDYDFSKWKGIPSLTGASIRTRMFDDAVKEFLSRSPQATVIEIGAGLNTRYERLDNGHAHWLEIDLPDAMALRKKFFDDTERRVQLSASVMDSEWLDRVAELPGPYCFVAEAVLIYLYEPEVRKALKPIGERFPGSWLITDTTSTQMVENQHKHDAMKKMRQESWFRWNCDDPNSLSDWGWELEKSQTFMDASPAIRASMPMSYRLLNAFFPWIVRRMTAGYHINQFRAVTHSAQ